MIYKNIKEYVAKNGARLLYLIAKSYHTDLEKEPEKYIVKTNFKVKNHIYTLVLNIKDITYNYNQLALMSELAMIDDANMSTLYSISYNSVTDKYYVVIKNNTFIYNEYQDISFDAIEWSLGNNEYSTSDYLKHHNSFITKFVISDDRVVEVNSNSSHKIIRHSGISRTRLSHGNTYLMLLKAIGLSSDHLRYKLDSDILKLVDSDYIKNLTFTELFKNYEAIKAKSYTPPLYKLYHHFIHSSFPLKPKKEKKPVFNYWVMPIFHALSKTKSRRLGKVSDKLVLERLKKAYDISKLHYYYELPNTNYPKITSAVDYLINTKEKFLLNNNLKKSLKKEPRHKKVLKLNVYSNIVDYLNNYYNVPMSNHGVDMYVYSDKITLCLLDYELSDEKITNDGSNKFDKKNFDDFITSTYKGFYTFDT
jgi:6-pyruvoyl-tetrahydropterin synthase/uncharacterized protein YacL (UPF0231 family)